MKNIANSSFGTPNCGPFSAQKGSANQPIMVPILNFANNFSYKIQTVKGTIIRKNSHCKHLGPHIVGWFDKMGVCHLAQNVTI